MLEGVATGCGQVGGTAGGQTDRWGLMVQAQSVGGGSQAQAKLSRRASRVPIACLVDGAR